MTKTKIITLMCSLPDSAGVNIKDRLLETEAWTKKETPPIEKMKEALNRYPFSIPALYAEEKGKELSNLFTEIYELEIGKTLFRLISLDGRTIFQDYLDKRLEFLGYKSDLIVFLSKHKSQSETKALTAHVSGNYAGADFGGRPHSLPVPAPLEMKKLLLVMDRLNNETGLGYDVTFEVTHHGPTELDTPSLFVEIGSTEKEWANAAPGAVVAKAVLSLAELNKSGAADERALQEANLLENNVIAVAFGGGHYGERQTAGIFRTKLAFGHMFPKYQLEMITEELILAAFEKTGATIAFFDKKSMRGPDRRRITEILEKNGILILNDKEAAAEYGVGFNLREKGNESGDE
ncbi:MAG: D-aminoacyl-tRNA deacylase [Methanosarcinales archaeon]|jgi:D-aminoacyl-tRNA deacylase|nr:D-aminoacyl-tRNA deacylase [Methanosarcinales archaeon]